jgi:putative endonuclease
MSAGGKKTGRQGEELAADYLSRLGYRILERNYRSRFGEIDMIAQEGDTLVFVEVKSRRTLSYGEPEQAVDKAKQRRLSLLSLGYLAEKGLVGRPARFDVVAVRLGKEGGEVELIKNAFDLAW